MILELTCNCHSPGQSTLNRIWVFENILLLASHVHVDSTDASAVWPDAADVESKSMALEHRLETFHKATFLKGLWFFILK